jgi:DNA-binding beta-propeller fold protein YncE
VRPAALVCDPNAVRPGDELGLIPTRRTEIEMQPIIRRATPAFLALVFVVVRLGAAPTATVQGIITDKSGKPIRAAMITASKGDERVTRFSQADGKYEIKVQPGTYDLESRAYGYSVKRLTKDVSQPDGTSFSLNRSFTITQLTSAEVEQLLPDNQDTRLIASECLRCHGFTYPARGGGMSASTWEKFLSRMTDARHWDNPYSGEEFEGYGFDLTDYKDRLSALSKALEKYFGPASPFFGSDADLPTMEQIKLLPPSNDVLRTTFHEFDLPNRDVGVHGIAIDDSGNAWFSEIQQNGNKIGKSDWQTKKYTEYPLPIPHSRPHSGVIGKDGLVWVPLTASKINSAIRKFDQRGETFSIYKPPTPFAMPYGLTADNRTGSIWYTDPNGNFISRFDPKTGKFDEFPIPSVQPSSRFPGIDNRSGRVWFTEALPDKIGYIELDPDAK